MEKQTLSAALNEFSQGTTDNIDSIMIKDAAGKQYWMKKADLASVLGELLGMESKMFTQALLYRGIANFDDFNKAGFGVWIIYGNQNSILNSPNVENYGTVLCLGDSSYFIVQIAFPRNNNTKITYRLRNDYYNSNWTNWSPL